MQQCGEREGQLLHSHSKTRLISHVQWINFIIVFYRFFLLQQLYMAAGENESEGSSMGSPIGGSLSLAEPVACAGSSAPLLCSDAILREGQQSEQLCVVCHYFPLSRALLPCRHTCICAICFCKYFIWGYYKLSKFLNSRYESRKNLFSQQEILSASSSLLSLWERHM